MYQLLLRLMLIARLLLALLCSAYAWPAQAGVLPGRGG